MVIFLKLYEHLKTKSSSGFLANCGLDNGMLEVPLPDGTRVAELLALLELPDTWGGLVIVNRSQELPGRVLSPGDLVELFPPMAGG